MRSSPRDDQRREARPHDDDPGETGPGTPGPAPARAAGTTIEVRGVDHHAGGRQVLHDVTLQIEPGLLVAVAGGSGAGKTTLLEVMAGLDPATSAEVMGVLRRLAQGGVTVVVTTHDPADIERCDDVVFLARDGHLAFHGPPADACRHFGVDDLTAIYRRLADDGTPDAWAEHVRTTRDARTAGSSRPGREVRTGGSSRPRRVSGGSDRVPLVRQWALLTRRSAEVMTRNRLTLAVLLGSPALVTAMMAVLFRPGAVESRDPGSLGATQTVFWIAFAGFFFGLTYGLLQVVGEMAVLRRERTGGLSIWAYVLSKVAVLLPVLAVVSAALLGVLRVLDRLPAAGADVYAALWFTLLLESLAALSLGLLASAAVTDAAQATLALPMLCFPQVLFAGAVVPVDEMSSVGRAISLFMANRWAFEALGRSLDLGPMTEQLPTMQGFQPAFTGSPAPAWVVLGLSAVVLTVATATVLERRCRPANGRA